MDLNYVESAVIISPALRSKNLFCRDINDVESAVNIFRHEFSWQGQCACLQTQTGLDLRTPKPTRFPMGRPLRTHYFSYRYPYRSCHSIAHLLQGLCTPRRMHSLWWRVSRACGHAELSCRSCQTVTSSACSCVARLS